ncbi:transketolase [uncultured Anaerococcus sp.]|uniref:transketolase n=1 Tax=uncultured Anaerococcus sp. TaxID=293428 RepID=UPI0028893957|nr:transketolase [uncultured Anaerococcus sp.]
MSFDQIFINTLRTLSADMVERAGSGHLGMPLGASPMVYELFKNHIKLDPQNTEWFDRDRFIYSSGHGTPLLYSLYHLFGYDISMEDLKNYRQLGSITPGHPENYLTKGVDATTGPLGQGFAMAVGFAIAETHLGAKYNKDDLKIIDHYTYVVCGDGDLMEGVALETASIAGRIGLNKLIVLYDSNDVCLDGNVINSTSDNIKKKFEAMNWNHIFVKDGENIVDVGKAIEEAKKSDKPSIIEVKNIIGFGTIDAGTNNAHSDPLGNDGIAYLKKQVGWEYEGDFYVPEEIEAFKEEYLKEASNKYEAWLDKKIQFKEKYPEDYEKLFNYKEAIKKLDFSGFIKYTEPKPIRVASEDVLNYVYDELGCLIGGSADLSKSNKVNIRKCGYLSKENQANSNIAFGVREFGMAAITNGISLHGGLIPFAATFLVFSEYMKSAIRHAALQKINPIYIFTHDTLSIGPDGPTHQPIEQLAEFRSVPNVDVIRPADPNEVIYSWKYALSNNKPTILINARQELPVLNETNYEKFVKGAYVIDDSDDYHATIIATGSEVSLALKAKEVLEEKGIRLRIVNMPSWELFEREDRTYQDSVIDRKKPVISIEASSGFGWERYTGKTENVICVNDFGESGNGQDLYEARGFNVKDIVARITEILS